MAVSRTMDAVWWCTFWKNCQFVCFFLLAFSKVILLNLERSYGVNALRWYMHLWVTKFIMKTEDDAFVQCNRVDEVLPSFLSDQQHSPVIIWTEQFRLDTLMANDTLVTAHNGRMVNIPTCLARREIRKITAPSSSSLYSNGESHS